MDLDWWRQDVDYEALLGMSFSSRLHTRYERSNMGSFKIGCNETKEC
jgi:hypothetical protein